MHSWGINVRFLGHVRHCSEDPSVKRVALLEMVARTLQKMLQVRSFCIRWEKRCTHWLEIFPDIDFMFTLSISRSSCERR